MTHVPAANCQPSTPAPYSPLHPHSDRLGLGLGQPAIRLALARTTNNLRQTPHLPIGIRIPPIYHIPDQIHRIAKRAAPIRRGRRVRGPERLLARVAAAPRHGLAYTAKPTGGRGHIAGWQGGGGGARR